MDVRCLESLSPSLHLSRENDRPSSESSQKTPPKRFKKEALLGDKSMFQLKGCLSETRLLAQGNTSVTSQILSLSIRTIN